MWVQMRSRKKRSWLITTAQPAKSVEGVFERAQGLDVEVVGRLVEEEDVAAGAQQLGEVDAVALAAGEQADLLLLVGALEVEGAAVGAGCSSRRAELDDVEAAGDFLPDGLAGIERVAGLVDVGELDRLAEGDGAGVGLLLAGEHAEQRGLAGAVRADDADDAAGGQREGQVVDQLAVAVVLSQVLDVDDVVAEARAVRDDDLGGGDLRRARILRDAARCRR